MRSRAARTCGSLVLFVTCLQGCGAPTEPPNPNATAKPPTAKPIPSEPIEENDAPSASLELAGPAGKVALMDSLAKVQRAFPRPSGAKSSDVPEFLAKGQTHFGWESDDTLFDAIAEKGKVVWMSYMDHSLTAPERTKAVERELDAFGEPAENAEGKNASVYSWERGDAVRVVLNLDAGPSTGLLRVVGKASILQNHLPLGSLGELVRQFDSQ